MKFGNYIKDKIFEITIYLFSIFVIDFILFLYGTVKFVLILALIIEIFTGITLLFYDFGRKNRYIKKMISNLEKLDKKFFIIETLPTPTTYEEKIFTEILYEINKSMIENIKEKEESIKDYKEFVELWIHEVKIPISSLILKCHNNKNEYSKDFTTQIRKLDNYVDEVLYYLRSETPEKDFVIKQTNLKEIVRNILLKNREDILENEIEIKSEIKNINVCTDSKWIEFVLNQIINNSIKYKRKEDAKIKIKTEEEKDRIMLIIWDNGIGIPKKDLSRVFEKSFTGSNGRAKTKSTGMGLYIAKNMCEKLGHRIEVDSKEAEFTEVKIIFGKNKYLEM